MSAYLHTSVEGNESFGGYLSVDGAKSFAISDDMTCELSPGHHSLVVYSTSDAQRSTAEMRASLYTHTSSSGALLDVLERKNIESDLGDGWEYDLMIEDHQMVCISILSKDTKLVSAPLFKTIDLEEEDLAMLEKHFAELEKQREEWRNTPIRSKPKMIWGIILAIAGIYSVWNILQTQPIDWQMVAVGCGMAALGVLLFVFGFRKKIRRK